MLNESTLSPERVLNPFRCTHMHHTHIAVSMCARPSGHRDGGCETELACAWPSWDGVIVREIHHRSDIFIEIWFARCGDCCPTL